MAFTPLMALHNDTRIPTTMPILSARPLLDAMRLACSRTILSILSGTTSCSSERLLVIVDALKYSP
jgi:hypothetical protein